MGFRVLVVEDDVDLRELLRFALQSEGYDVVTAENGVEAFVRLAYESRPDVVVLDLMMPVIAGAEVLDHMRGDPRLVDVPVLLVTGARVPQDVSTAVDAILVKPFELDSLYETVAVLSRR